MSALWVVPCGAGKLERPAAAARLYTSSHFQLVLNAARRAAAADPVPARVVILSALHGLLELGKVVAPYDMTMRDSGSVTSTWLQVQLAALVDDAGVTSVHTLLPKAYLQRLEPAAAALELQLVDHYAGARGIGHQRGIAARLAAGCQQCGCAAAAAVGVLPAGWEYERPGDPSSPMWCNQCVRQLLDDVQHHMLLAAQRGAW